MKFYKEPMFIVWAAALVISVIGLFVIYKYDKYEKKKPATSTGFGLRIVYPEDGVRCAVFNKMGHAAAIHCDWNYGAEK